LVGRQEGHPACKNGGWWRWALVSPDGVAPSQMVGVSASVNLLLHHKVQKFSSGTGSPRWFQKKGRKMVVVVVVLLRRWTRLTRAAARIGPRTNGTLCASRSTAHGAQVFWPPDYTGRALHHIHSIVGVNCLRRSISKMTCRVSSAMLNAADTFAALEQFLV